MATSQKPIRIGVGQFAHETCTFCPTPTGVDEWEFYGPPMRGDAVLEAGSYIRGFASRAREYGDVELIGAYSPRDARGGSSGSWVTREAFDKYSHGMAADLQAAGDLDGVYLSLHGAMAVSEIPKPEAELVRRVRAALGEIPIVVTLDLHANEDHELSDAADAVFILKRFPHYDSRYQGERAARLLIRTIRGDYKPTMATRKPKIITPSVFQWTGASPSMEIMERARRWEDRAADAFVSVAYGFAYADVPDVGATVMVVTNDDQKLADEIADDMADYIWRVREPFAGQTLPETEEGVALAISAALAGKTPVVVADHSDRTGNSTHILAELIRQQARRFCVATIADEKGIEKLQKHSSEGDFVSLEVGGYADPFAGDPVPIEGRVEYLGQYGRHQTLAVLRFGEDNRVILTPQLHQVTRPDIFSTLRIDLDELEIIVLKSRVHFRAGFDETGLAGSIVVVDAPGLGPADLRSVPYKNIPGDLYPLCKEE